MAKEAAKKIIQIPIEDDLLERIDETAAAMATSRAAFIREACKLRLQRIDNKKLDRRYMAGYRKHPEKTEWAETGATLLAQMLPEEEW
ncbi:MAG: ribbon-helix-helix protein, CopG family [Deltaproteobacteria bacterium]|nr:ribbon-helix-helix protein, CopG family [Deltaproteobacteria bacterium]